MPSGTGGPSRWRSPRARRARPSSSRAPARGQQGEAGPRRRADARRGGRGRTGAPRRSACTKPSRSSPSASWRRRMSACGSGASVKKYGSRSRSQTRAAAEARHVREAQVDRVDRARAGGARARGRARARADGATRPWLASGPSPPKGTRSIIARNTVWCIQSPQLRGPAPRASVTTSSTSGLARRAPRRDAPGAWRSPRRRPRRRG